MAKTCTSCGGPIRPDSKWGICVRNAECRQQRHRAHAIGNRDSRNARRRGRYHRLSLPALAHRRAQRRAAECGLTFTISIADVEAVWRDTCPVFDRPLVKGSRPGPWSPSLDRIDNSHGYEPGNLQVLSQKANAMKLNATRDELIQFARWALDQEGIAHE